MLTVLVVRIAIGYILMHSIGVDVRVTVQFFAVYQFQVQRF